MELKTCEEFVIHELETTRQELFLTQKKLEEANETIKNYSEDPRMLFKDDFTHVNNSVGGIYYRLDMAYKHQINESIKDGSLSVDQIKDFLKNENKDFLNIRVGGKDSYGSDLIGKINEYDYDTLFVSKDKVYVARLSSASLYEANVDDIWLKKEDAERELIKQIKERMQEVLDSLEE